MHPPHVRVSQPASVETTFGHMPEASPPSRMPAESQYGIMPYPPSLDHHPAPYQNTVPSAPYHHHLSPSIVPQIPVNPVNVNTIYANNHNKYTTNPVHQSLGQTP